MVVVEKTIKQYNNTGNNERERTRRAASNSSAAVGLSADVSTVLKLFYETGRYGCWWRERQGDTESAAVGTSGASVRARWKWKRKIHQPPTFLL